MRTNNIKVTLSYKIPYDVPDLNGNIYTKEAIEKAIAECKESLQNGGKLPLIYNNNNTVTKEEVIGVIEHLWDVQYNEIEKYIQVELWGCFGMAVLVKILKLWKMMKLFAKVILNNQLLN